MPIKIFLSHSATDEPLASALVDCLMASMVLDDDELRCTSVAGHKLPVGSDFAATLLEDIGDSSVVIGLVTRNALSSSWVLFELGATWGAKKNMKPVVTDEVDLKMLPGPVSGRHVARMSSRSDVAQFLEEITSLIAAKPRSAAKVNKAIETVLTAHCEHVASQAPATRKGKVDAKAKEPTFAGVPFSELVKILGNETVKVPSAHNNGEGDAKTTLFDLFMGNAKTLSNGLQSNYDEGTPGHFLYHEVALRLLSYGLVSFDKVPAAQAKWFKRLVISPEGHKFILQYKRAASTTQ
jgi:hypothetical protein